jgi:hypothetical protein
VRLRCAGPAVRIVVDAIEAEQKNSEGGRPN